MSVVAEEATDGRTMSLLEVCVRNGGIRKGAKAAEVIVAWAIAEQKLGRRLGEGIRREGVSAAVCDYAKYWKMAERTAWRDLERFREVFPDDESPEHLASVLRAVMEQNGEKNANVAMSDVRLAVE